MSFRVPLKKRDEKSNAEHCPEQREGSVLGKRILRFAQDDLLSQVRFLPSVEMTENMLSCDCDTAPRGRGEG